MNTTAAPTHIDTVRLTAEADQHNAAAVDERWMQECTAPCDSLFGLCAHCAGHRVSARARRHVVRVEAVRAGVR